MQHTKMRFHTNMQSHENLIHMKHTSQQSLIQVILINFCGPAQKDMNHIAILRL